MSDPTNSTKKNHRVLMVLQSDFPPDMRVEKEALSLIASGYKVTILCDNRIKRPRRSNYKGINIRRMRHHSFFNGKLHRLINLPTPINPLWFHKIKKTAKQIHADILHVHDLPLAYTTIQIGRQFKIPVVFDLHENYPAAMQLWRTPGLMGSTFRNPDLAKRIEKECLKHADKIIVVSHEHKTLLSSQGVITKKIYVVENTPRKSLAQNNTPNNVSNSEFILLHFGRLSIERNIELALQAIHKILPSIPNLKVVLIGNGPQLEELKQMAHDLKVADYVEFKGWMNLHDAIPYFQKSKICFLTQSSNALIDNGIPNKLFEYMALGKPILAANSKAISKIITKTKCGEIFLSGSVDSFVEHVVKMKESKKPYGTYGKKAILEKYNWEQTEKSLIKLYKSLTIKK